MDYTDELRKIEAEYPHLSKTGFKDWHPMNERDYVSDRWAARYATRAALSSGDGPMQFARAIEWLRKFKPRKTVSKESSYALKHWAEREQGDYVSNGALIAAALFLGLPVRHNFGTPNANIGIGRRIAASEGRQR